MTPFAASLLLLASSGAPVATAAPAVVGIVAGTVSAGTNGVDIAPATVGIVAGQIAASGGYRSINGDLVTNGSSSVSGVGGANFQDRIDSRTDGGTILNLGVGGTDGETIRNSFFAQSAPVKARWQLFQFGGNGDKTVAGMAANQAWFEECIAEAGHDNWIAMPKMNDAGMGWGSFEGTNHRYLRSLHAAVNPLKVLYLDDLFREIPGLAGVDLTDQYNNVFATSLRLDASHTNQAGHNFIGDEVVRWIDHFNLSGAGLPFFPSYMPVHATAATGRQQNGVLATVPYLGSLTGVTVSGGIGGQVLVQQVGAEIRLVNLSVGPLSAGRYKVPITFANSEQSRTDYVYLYPGSATTAPSRIVLDGNTWITTWANPFPSAAPEITIAIDLELDAADAGVDRYIASTSIGAGINIRRVSSNVWRFIIRPAEAPGGGAFTINTPAGSAVGGVRQRLVFSASAPGGIAHITLNGVAYQATFAPFVAWNLAPGNGTESMFFANNSGASSGALRGKFSQMWVGRTYVAPGTPANDAFYNPDGSAKDLGAGAQVNGVSPDYLWRGSAGDFASGHNPGLMGRVFPALRSVPVTEAFGDAVATADPTAGRVGIIAGQVSATVSGEVATTPGRVGIIAGTVQAGEPLTVTLAPGRVGIVGGVVVLPAQQISDEWLTLIEAKQHLEVDFGDDDLKISADIDAARLHIEAITGLFLKARTETRSYARFVRELVLPGAPVRGVVVRYLDADEVEQTVPPETYRLGSRDGRPVLLLRNGQSWPTAACYPDAVMIDLLVGPATRADVPEDVRKAGKLLVGHYYKHREAVLVGAGGTELPMAVEALLVNHRLQWLA